MKTKGRKTKRERKGREGSDGEEREREEKDRRLRTHGQPVRQERGARVPTGPDRPANTQQG